MNRCFDRGFERMDLLEEDVAKSGWFRELLDAWTPAGIPLSEERPLRIAIRDNQIHLYHLGQRIACVWAGRGQANRAVLKLKVHGKFVFPDVKRPNAYAILVGSEIKCRDGLQEYKSDYVPGSIAHWVQRSRLWNKNEKPLVEEAVAAANAQLLDIEMQVPESGNQIDLVLLEETAHKGVQLAFWEAKTAHSREMGKIGDPQVISQLKRYEETLNDHEEVICEAYTKACTVLADLHRMACASGTSGMPPLGSLIQQVADGDKHLQASKHPRLLVLPAPRKTAGKNDKEHRNKIRRAGYPVLFASNGPMVLNLSAVEDARMMEA